MRVFYCRFMPGDNFKLLVHEDDDVRIARVLTSFLLKMRGDYSPECEMAKKSPSETDSHMGKETRGSRIEKWISSRES